MTYARRCMFVLAYFCGVMCMTLESRSTASMEMRTRMSERMHASLALMAKSMLAQEPVKDTLRSLSSQMDVHTALRIVKNHSLPHDVASLVEVVSQDGGGFTEDAMEKARVALNGLVESAWRDMDDKIIACKEYEEMNRNTFDQVSADISRIGEQISDLQRVEAEATEGAVTLESQIRTVESTLKDESQTYTKIQAENGNELTIRQNDLDVFNFILETTKCPDATSLLQKKSASRVCSCQGGDRMLQFSDKAAQQALSQKLTQHSRKALSNVLAQMYEDPVAADEGTADANTTGVIPPEAIYEAPVAGEDQPLWASGDGMSCEPMSCSGPVPADRCGLLHDRLALLWGEYKDKVDELTMEVARNDFEFEELKLTLNEQVKVLVNSKARFAMQLSESRSNLAADRSQQKEKDMQLHDIDKQFHHAQKGCCEAIHGNLQDICALTSVRNAALTTSSTCPGNAITDCEVDEWIPGKCSAECDDECPLIPTASEVYECGGWENIARKIVVSPDPVCGIQCPALVHSKKCNQMKCPVDCEMSEWSGWSKCTADCEGGVRGRTRSIMVKPANGGQDCNTNEESESCNTASCDRDCALTSWDSWSPCSVACGGGFQESKRHVLVPTRGYGKCPKESSKERVKKRVCNDHECIGDEICVARQDLVIAVDGSGSMSEDGFGTVKQFVVDLMARYNGRYFGADAMKIGVVQFGNGVVMSDDTVSPARNLQPLSSDMTQVTSALQGMTWAKGFTNMAQAFALTERMFTAGGRPDAQSAVLVITDGKPSFQFQTNELVEQLDDKNVQRFFMVIDQSSGKSSELDLMKGWASRPWETNLVHIPGLDALRADSAEFIEKAVTMFCSDSFSMSLQLAKEQQEAYLLVKEQAYCGARGAMLSTRVSGADQCAALARGAGATGFLLGTWFRRGYCYASGMAVAESQYSVWADGSRVDPDCPVGWTNSRIYDFYAINPSAA